MVELFANSGDWSDAAFCGVWSGVCTVCQLPVKGSPVFSGLSIVKSIKGIYSGTSIIQSPKDQTVLFELLRLWTIEG